MKKILIFTSLITLGIVGSSVFAHQWNWMWQGRGFSAQLTAEQRAQLQQMSPEERRVYIQKLREQYWFEKWSHSRKKDNHNPADIINKYPVSNITDEIKEGIYNQYGEEKMAHDLYQYAYEKYWLTVFKNIAESETRHMEAMKVLLDRYGITPPQDYAADTQLAVELKAKIDEGLEQALNVGVTIEEVDIKDLAKLVKDAYDVEAKDLIAVYTNIAGGSYNHLRGFLKALKDNDYTLPDVSEYLPEDVTVDDLLNMKGPEAKKLFAEYVKKVYGIDVSEYQTQCDKEQNSNQNMNQRKYHRQINRNNNRSNFVKSRAYANSAKVNRYKNIIMQKYGSKINTFTENKIRKIIDKIDVLISKIESSITLSDTKKETYISILVALKEILEEKLYSLDNVLNSVFGE